MSRSGQAVSEVSVLIVGAGPVGLLMANLLGRLGIGCLVVEKRCETINWSRAIGITPPSLDIFSGIGLSQSIIRLGVMVEKALVHDHRGLAGTVNFNDLESDCKFILTLPQVKTMALLESSLYRYSSVDLWRGVALTGLDCEQAGVRARLRDLAEDREQEVSAGWIVGCDGADSTVRKLMGIPFYRRSYASEFIMADYAETTSWGAEAHLFFTRRGPVESFPLPNHQRRWITELEAGRQWRDGEARDWLTSRAGLYSGNRLAGQRKSRFFRFVPEKAMAGGFFCKRAILAGDAAHLMSPIGGQGMNTGFADAAQLAAIIPDLLVSDKLARSELLEAYSRSRQCAASSARRRAAVGMWVGTRTGMVMSALRGKFFRHVLFRKPLQSRVPAHFAMLTIPGRKTGPFSRSSGSGPRS